ncbi:helicase associated domain-containing protein [Streptomyces sp. NPDC019890]|uniref:helicase associated domain-containing protein n=1 Tax=Streptomyces sp. NPDC019890 TaxID=3365064 RepID=UPI0038500CDA
MRPPPAGCRRWGAGAEEALVHARSYTAEHGHLAQVSATTVHHGYPLGRWLAGQRSQQQRKVLSPERQQALNAIDPWWCPPWNLRWQRYYYRARDTADSRFLQAENGFDDLDDSRAADWLWRQCATYDELHPKQRQLLADIGITTDVARTALHHARTAPKSPAAASAPGTKDKTSQARRAADPPTPTGQRRARRAAEPKRPREPRSRLGHRPDLRPGFETALAHARAWHAEHGRLAAPRDTRHHGYPLGMWLFSQRNRANNAPAQGCRPHPT